MGAIDKIAPDNLNITKLNQWVDQCYKSRMAEYKVAHTPSQVIITTNDTFDRDISQT